MGGTREGEWERGGGAGKTGVRWDSGDPGLSRDPTDTETKDSSEKPGSLRHPPPAAEAPKEGLPGRGNGMGGPGGPRPPPRASSAHRSGPGVPDAAAGTRSRGGVRVWAPAYLRARRLHSGRMRGEGGSPRPPTDRPDAPPVPQPRPQQGPSPCEHSPGIPVTWVKGACPTQEGPVRTPAAPRRLSRAPPRGAAWVTHQGIHSPARLGGGGRRERGRQRRPEPHPRHPSRAQRRTPVLRGPGGRRHQLSMPHTASCARGA